MAGPGQVQPVMNQISVKPDGHLTLLSLFWGVHISKKIRAFS